MSEKSSNHRDIPPSVHSFPTRRSSDLLVERKAKLVKTVEIHAAVSSTDTAVKIKKGHMLLTTDIIGNGSKSVTVGTIDTSDDDFDELTITANALGTLSAGAVLQTATAAGSSKAVVNPDGLNPFEVLIDANPLCDVMFKADGIVVSRLPQKINDTIKTALKFCQFT